MRDIKRIDRICKKLAKLWKCYPDQRFGQLIINYLPITFDIEDEEKDAWRPGYSIESRIDDQLKECELWQRVRKETNFLKDSNEWLKQLSKKGPAYSQELWDKEPKWVDYIKDLKPLPYNHVGRKCGKTNMIRDKIIDEVESNE